MKLSEEKLNELISEVDQVLKSIQLTEDQYQEPIHQVAEPYRKSARNLIHYHAFRSHDLRGLQKKLKNMGLSRLANAGGHVKSSLLNTQQILHSLKGDGQAVPQKSGLSIKNGKKLLVNHTREVLGNRSHGRRVRIMVTQPTESAHNYQLVNNMVKAGMNCARINCAHDEPATWLKIIENVKKAGKAHGRQIKITMDLAGPKSRTGSIEQGPRVRKFSPSRDEMGNVIDPATILLVPKLEEEFGDLAIPVDSAWLKTLLEGDKLQLVDTRQKVRTLKVVHVGSEMVIVNLYETSYIGTGTMLEPQRENADPTAVGELPPIERAILLRVNDYITLHKEDLPGAPAIFDQDGNLLKEAHIACLLEEVFTQIKPGERVLFDDGKIEGIVTSTSPEAFGVKIVRAKELGSKLKAEKGINFPDTDLKLGGLTDKDRRDLEFVAYHADTVNFSFVNSPEDVSELLTTLDKLGALNQLNIVLKIETQKAFDNLTNILLTAMKAKYIGVMIARGDLAVETGWDNIGWVQREILAICNAAHVPVIWATQVLESLAKKGLPSRSEITDAATSLKAECVMLNKGAYILNAIKLLDSMLVDMENYDEKNESMLPPMERLVH